MVSFTCARCARPSPSDLSPSAPPMLGPPARERCAGLRRLAVRARGSHARSRLASSAPRHYGARRARRTTRAGARASGPSDAAAEWHHHRGEPGRVRRRHAARATTPPRCPTRPGTHVRPHDTTTATTDTTVPDDTTTATTDTSVPDDTTTAPDGDTTPGDPGPRRSGTWSPPSALLHLRLDFADGDWAALLADWQERSEKNEYPAALGFRRRGAHAYRRAPEGPQLAAHPGRGPGVHPPAATRSSSTSTARGARVSTVSTRPSRSTLARTTRRGCAIA